MEENSIRYTIRPNIASKIVLRTLPYGVCTLHPEGDVGSAGSLKIFADRDGIVQFHVRPDNASDNLTKVMIDCNVNGNVTHFPLELRAGYTPTHDMPAPPLEKPRRMHNDALVLPALSENEAFQLSDQELLSRGYPPRPNLETVPEAFNAWRRAFSNPLILVEPRTVPNTDISHGLGDASNTTGDSYNWSGFLLTGGAPYCVVAGVWDVPSVYSRENRDNATWKGEHIVTQSSFWVGLDGWKVTPYSLDDLPQAGTEQQSVDIHDLTFSTYYAWTQFVPQQEEEQVVTELHVNPGDRMYVGVWMGDEHSNLSLNGDAIFSLTNMTTGEYAKHSTSRTSKKGTTVVSGTMAVWIMERPTNIKTNRYTDLADYHSATMTSAYAAPASGSGSFYSDHSNIQIQMKERHKPFPILSTVTSIDRGTMRFSWQNFGSDFPRDP